MDDRIKLVRVVEREESLAMAFFKLLFGSCGGLLIASDWCMRTHSKTAFDHEPVDLPQGSVLHADHADPCHPRSKAGARTVLWCNGGKETYVTQPLDYVRKVAWLLSPG